MGISFSLIGALVPALAFSISFADQKPSRARGPHIETKPGEFVVKVKPGVDLGNIAFLEEKLGSQIQSVISDDRLIVVKRSEIETEESAVRILTKSELVEFAEPNFIYRAVRLPSDPLFDKQWGLFNHGQDDAKSLGTPGMDIGVEKAWDITTGSDDVLIAIIDTGIDDTHPDLISNLWTNSAEAEGLPGVDDDKNGYVDDIHGYNFVDALKPSGIIKDDHGHGSHCAGVIGASGNDGKGIVGVNWRVKMMALKFLGSDGGGSLEAAVKAIDYATKMKVKIMSNSWGGGGESQALKEAIERAEAAGILFVAAAGNDSLNNDSSPHYPSSYKISNILSVAAIDNAGQLAAFSNFGKKSVHVAAPGVNIYSSVKNGGYDSWSGTSMATPFVSGIAGLLAARNPEMNFTEIKNRIMTTTKTLPSLRSKVSSGGIAQAYFALTNQISPPDLNDPIYWASKPVSFSTAHPYGKKENLTFEVSVPGARELSLYFERFETEKGYDKLFIYDKDENLISDLSGNWDEAFSPTVSGDYVKIVFKTDDSVEKFGFDLTKISYR